MAYSNKQKEEIQKYIEKMKTMGNCTLWIKKKKKQFE